ncbi:uncharacterized protein LOC127715530 [Mytilus californianus]|uniref:uncharacterized protein LOC127715530 n=1 Tax=Mytilus californianus TaxID=6549 RepID=UPI002245A7AF|nr:uncharacterized protein LOC127715530 [Mytilus californianus]XP_052077553.1 uncharacterized protein LOC127715530 [Mytilus californianus]XP_052077554.1 uncharacterized protein LOC127715530 [Mytilus californianus]XP_052077555.1 uncharacterized protein LOC127715530 [Mytilus californianus]XP_052077556.1 uncharacterized protein LOC127715530 [Mytilus californianus]
MSATAKKQDLLVEAKSFCDGLSNVFLMKRRDPQTRNLLDTAKRLIESLCTENQKPTVGSHGTATRSTGGMGQLWVKLDELKRENEELRKHRGSSHEDRSQSTKTQHGPGAELNKIRHENESLKIKLAKHEKTIKELEQVNANLQEQNKSSKVALETTQRSMETVLKEYRLMEDSVKCMKSENDTLKQRVTRSVKPLPRLDNRQVENLSEKCRPSNIAVAYNSLESQQWIEAKESLEDNTEYEEEIILRILCSILVKTYECCTDVKDASKSTIAEIINQPTIVVSDLKSASNGKNKLPEELTDAVGQLYRKHYDNIDTDVISQNALSRVMKEFNDIDDSCLNNKLVVAYAKESANLAWQMVIQQPPMCLSVQDTKFNDDYHKLWWSCDQSRASEIEFFVWPALYDYKNGNLLIKGCVFTN